MKCFICDTENEENALNCAKCGAKLKSDQHVEIQEKKKVKINPFILIIIGLLVVLGVLLYFLLRPARDKQVLGSKNHFSFNINEDKFSLVDSFSNYIEKGYYVLDNESFIDYDAIAIENIYKDDKNIGLAIFYCSNKQGCNFKDTAVIKLNLFKNSNCNIKDVKYGTSKKDVEKNLGKEKGVLASDNTYHVWSFGNNVGDGYIMIKYHNDKVNDIKIGVWWYDDEYENTVKEVE